MEYNDLLLQHKRIVERLHAVEKRVDEILSRKNVKIDKLEKFEKQSSSFKKIETKQKVKTQIVQ